jgi:hypothetical protein
VVVSVHFFLLDLPEESVKVILEFKCHLEDSLDQLKIMVHRIIEIFFLFSYKSFLSPLHSGSKIVPIVLSCIF